MRSSTTPLRRLSVAVTALALGAALVGCGSSDDKSDAAATPTTPPAKVLSETEATAALITEGNLGGIFKVVPDDGEPESDAPGCMNDVADILDDDSPAKTTADRDLGLSEDGKSSQVSNKVLSYESVEAAETAIKDLRTALTACTEVKDTDDDGFTYDLTVTTNDTKDESGADDQVNADASGTIAATDGSSGKISFLLAVVRKGNNITAITGSTVETELPGPLSDLVEVAYDRLVAIADGKTPDESVVAGS